MAEIFGSLVSLLSLTTQVLEIGKAAISTNLFYKPAKGLRVVYEDAHPQIDIVFVHGLGGDPEKTWTTDGKEQQVNWMTDLLPRDIRSAKKTRILTFSYSTNLFATRHVIKRRASSTWQHERMLEDVPQALYLNSKSLVQELTDLRGSSARNRALIFVAHSFGGLIVEEALVQASAAIGENIHHKALQLCTAGVLFFGTPQRETSSRPWGNVLTRMLSVSLEIPPDLHHIQPTEQAELFDLQIQRYKSIALHYPNYSFCERRATKTGDSRDEGLYVVPEEHILPLDAPSYWHKIRLRGDHYRMVKFAGRDDRGYQLVLDCITDCLSHSEKASARCSDYFQTWVNRHTKSSALEERTKRLFNGEEDAKVKQSIIRVNSWGTSQRRAEALKEELLRSEKINGTCHRSTLELVKQLALHFVDNKEYPKAELLYKRLFVSVQDLEGPWNPVTADTLQWIAEVVQEQGHYSEATDCLSQVQTIQKVALPFSDLRICSTRASMAILYDKQRRWEDAEKMYKEVIRIREAKLGEGNEDTLNVLENLALHYQMRGVKRWPQAVECLERILKIRQKSLESRVVTNDGPLYLDNKTAGAVKKLARLYEDMGNTKQLSELHECWAEVFAELETDSQQPRQKKLDTQAFVERQEIEDAAL